MDQDSQLAVANIDGAQASGLVVEDEVMTPPPLPPSSILTSHLPDELGEMMDDYEGEFETDESIEREIDQDMLQFREHIRRNVHNTAPIEFDELGEHMMPPPRDDYTDELDDEIEDHELPAAIHRVVHQAVADANNSLVGSGAGGVVVGRNRRNRRVNNRHEDDDEIDDDDDDDEDDDDLEDHVLGGHHHHHVEDDVDDRDEEDDDDDDDDFEEDDDDDDDEEDFDAIPMPPPDMMDEFIEVEGPANLYTNQLLDDDDLNGLFSTGPTAIATFSTGVASDFTPWNNRGIF